MSTDPLGEALGGSEPAAAPQPGQPAGQAQGTAGYQAPPAYEAPPVQESQPAAAWEEPQPERSLLERRPEILVGAAMAGGFVFAQLLGRVRGR